MGVCIVREQASNLRLLEARQGTIRSFPICLFLPSADISNLFELFFTQNYLHTPTLHLPHQGTICSLPTCFFCPALIFQICLNYFLPEIIHIPPLRVPCLDNQHVPGAATYVPFLPSADISNLFELFLPKIIDIPPPAIHHAKASSAPSLYAFFAER